MIDLPEKLKDLGNRPCPGAVQEARQALARIDANLSRKIESIKPQNIDEVQFSIAELQDAAEQDRTPHKGVLWLDQLYQAYDAIMAAKVLHEPFEKGKKKSDDKSSADDSDEMTLSGLQLNRLELDHGILCNLVSLDLSKNNLEALPDYFEGLRHLRFLNLSGNMIKSLPESISRCSSLVELDASFNQLEFLPSTFGSRLPELEKLFLQLNKLITLPPAITRLSSLTHLEVQFNKLLALPVDIGSLQSLIKLDASGNFSNLSSLPDSIGSASSLQVLDLSYNQITKLPLSVGKLTQLRELRLVSNPIIVPPIQVVEHSTKAVVEYMSELLKKSLEVRTTATSPCRSISIKRRRGSPSLSLLLGNVFGSICHSSSSVLGNTGLKFVGLRDDLSSDSD